MRCSTEKIGLDTRANHDVSTSACTPRAGQDMKMLEVPRIKMPP